MAICENKGMKVSSRWYDDSYVADVDVEETIQQAMNDFRKG